jgi:serine protease Do
MSKRIVQTPIWVAAGIVAAALVLGGFAGQMTRGGPVFTVAAAGPDVHTDVGVRTTFAPIVKIAAPAVVNIWSSRLVHTQPNDMQQLQQDPFFRHFFGDMFGQLQVPRERRERSLGSGVIVSRDGYILTNYHVVENGSDVKVSLNDRREFPARVIGSDSKTDLAVVKIDQTDLQPIKLGDSSKVEVGDISLAIGDPFGIGRTVTMGVVSAVGRGGLGIEEYEDFIQTDASINPGNSGGALINMDGDLIGISTAILSSGSGGNQGIGFAVPVNMARSVMDQIVRSGKVSRGYLGVALQEITPDMANAFKLKDLQGALIGDVERGSPADKAGLHPGDVVIKLDANLVPDSRSLQLAIGQMQPGRVVHLTIIRDGKQSEVSATLVEHPNPPKKEESSSNERDSSASQILDGVQATAMTSQIARELQLPANTKGVVLMEVAPGSAAADAGLKRGDVILEVNRKPITTLEQLAQSVSHSGKQPIILFLNRSGRTIYAVIHGG